MICSRCNTYNPNDACFCRHCGRKFADTESDKFSASISVLNQKLSSSIANNTKLRKDIAERTDGDIYVGVVGPVRTRKINFY